MTAKAGISGEHLDYSYGMLPLEAWLDEHGLGRGPLAATRIGSGHSNATFLLERGNERMVLRRAPRPPLPPSAHDMLREARVLGGLQGRARVPRVLAVCAEADVLGVPFYVMEELRGHVVTEELPRRSRAPMHGAGQATISSMHSPSSTPSTSSAPAWPASAAPPATSSAS